MVHFTYVSILHSFRYRSAIDREQLGSVLRLHQHSIPVGYMGNGFTGQETQPTVSKYTEGTR